MLNPDGRQSRPAEMPSDVVDVIDVATNTNVVVYEVVVTVVVNAALCC